MNNITIWLREPLTAESLRQALNSTPMPIFEFASGKRAIIMPDNISWIEFVPIEEIKP